MNVNEAIPSSFEVNDPHSWVEKVGYAPDFQNHKRPVELLNPEGKTGKPCVLFFARKNKHENPRGLWKPRV